MTIAATQITRARRHMKAVNLLELSRPEQEAIKREAVRMMLDGCQPLVAASALSLRHQCRIDNETAARWYAENVADAKTTIVSTDIVRKQEPVVPKTSAVTKFKDAPDDVREKIRNRIMDTEGSLRVAREHVRNVFNVSISMPTIAAMRVKARRAASAKQPEPPPAMQDMTSALVQPRKQLIPVEHAVARVKQFLQQGPFTEVRITKEESQWTMRDC